MAYNLALIIGGTSHLIMFFTVVHNCGLNRGMHVFMALFLFVYAGVRKIKMRKIKTRNGPSRKLEWV